MFLYKIYEQFKEKHPLMKKDITSLFVFIDDFCKKYDAFLAHQTLPKKTHTRRTPSISGSEIITIILLFHQSPAKKFKYFYESYLPRYTTEFPKMVSYNRFIELQQRYLGHIYPMWFKMLRLWCRYLIQVAPS